jgi:predicted protein tyrosine phosphatase
MKISILPHIALSTGKPIENLIFITDKRNPFFCKGTEQVLSSATHSLMLQFDDIEKKENRFVLPTKDDVEAALNFANDKDNIVVSCTGGISRSSAIAFLIVAKREGIEEALKILNPKLHFPNSLIIELGAKLLKKPEIVKAIEDWKQMADKICFGENGIF